MLQILPFGVVNDKFLISLNFNTFWGSDYLRFQGFRCIIFNLTDRDPLDTDPPKNANKFINNASDNRREKISTKCRKNSGLNLL